MAEMFTVSVAGLKETEAALREVSKAAAKSQARKALKAGGEVAARRARGLVHVDHGYMRESIDVGTRLTRRQSSLHRRTDPVEVFVGPNDPGAIGLEFGHDGAPAHPFMRPAWDETHRAVLKRTTDQLMVGVSHAVTRARRKMAKGL